MDYYHKYLKSKHWQAFRFSILEKEHNCYLCGNEGDLSVHHKHYETLGHESIDDIEVLCSRCHQLRTWDKQGFTVVDCDIVRALKPQALKMYLIIKIDCALNKGSSQLTYEQIRYLLSCSTKTACRSTKKLIETYNLIRKTKNGNGSIYTLTHPDEWTLGKNND